MLAKAKEKTLSVDLAELIEFAKSCGISIHDWVQPDGKRVYSATVEGIELAEKLMEIQKRIEALEPVKGEKQ